jgi:hypothetical protein
MAMWKRAGQGAPRPILADPAPPMPPPVTGPDGAPQAFETLATRLPADLIAPEWRAPERWRRLAVEARGGRRYLPLPGLLLPEAAASLRAAALALPFAPLSTELLVAERCLVDGDVHAGLAPWLALIASPELRALAGAVLGRELSAGLVVNAWRLQKHHFMGVHPDGPWYEGTFSIGLSTSWEAAMGGAIAFGARRDDGSLAVAERWFPHLGDALLFAPDETTWHAVEAVTGPETRLSLTGWWVEPGRALSWNRQTDAEG